MRMAFHCTWCPNAEPVLALPASTHRDDDGFGAAGKARNGVLHIEPNNECFHDPRPHRGSNDSGYLGFSAGYENSLLYSDSIISCRSDSSPPPQRKHGQPAEDQCAEMLRSYPQALKEGIGVWKVVPRSTRFLFISELIARFSIAMNQTLFLVYAFYVLQIGGTPTPGMAPQLDPALQQARIM